jgi:predicted dehydrogenase
MKKINCAVVGVGYLGKFHADKYTVMPNANLVAVCDSDGERAKEIAEKHNVEAFTDYHELVGKIDAVSIAVPTFLHYEVTKFFLENGIHVLLEKPITTLVSEADELLKIANKQKLIFQIGHLERFNSVFMAVQPLLKNPVFVEAIRLAPFKARGTDVNVILDLMIHDIDLIQNIIKSPIKDIRAYGAPVLSDKIDLANAHIEFMNGAIASLTASRVNMHTKRKMRIFQLENCLACDFNDKTLTIYRKSQSKIKPYLPEIVSEKINVDSKDALEEEIIAFVKAINGEHQPLVTASDAKNALAVALKITEIAEEKAKNLFAAFSKIKDND